MNAIMLLYVGFALALGAMGLITIWAPRGVHVRTVAVALVAGSLPLAYLGLNEMLSKPKPVAHEWFKRHVDEATVVGMTTREGEAIYLWLELDGTREPRAYVLPWQQALAEKLENLVDEAIREQTEVKIKNPFARRSFDDLGDFNVHLVAPPRLPLKPPPRPGDVFDPRQRRI